MWRPSLAFRSTPLTRHIPVSNIDINQNRRWFQSHTDYVSPTVRRRRPPRAMCRKCCRHCGNLSPLCGNLSHRRELFFLPRPLFFYRPMVRRVFIRLMGFMSGHVGRLGAITRIPPISSHYVWLQVSVDDVLTGIFFNTSWRTRCEKKFFLHRERTLRGWIDQSIPHIVGCLHFAILDEAF